MINLRISNNLFKKKRGYEKNMTYNNKSGKIQEDITFTDYNLDIVLIPFSQVSRHINLTKFLVNEEHTEEINEILSREFDCINIKPISHKLEA